MNSFLPIGSVLTLKNSKLKNKRYVILGYLPTISEEQPKIFDYLCYPYPEGIKSKKKYYVNEDDIEDIYYIGYQSEYNDKLLKFFKEQSTVLKNGTNIENISLDLILKFNDRYGKENRNG